MTVKKNLLKLMDKYTLGGTMYNLEERVIHFVFQAFHEINRKKENISLAFHSIMVGTMLKNIGCEESLILAGYLHDIIEDTSYDYDYLQQQFGKTVADLVLRVTENQTISDWRGRKEDVIIRLEKESRDVLLIELADKLQNLISDYDLYLEKGKESLNTEADGYEDLKWYYLSLKRLFNSHLENNDLLARYNEITTIYFL